MLFKFKMKDKYVVHIDITYVLKINMCFWDKQQIMLFCRISNQSLNQYLSIISTPCIAFMCSPKLKSYLNAYCDIIIWILTTKRISYNAFSYLVSSVWQTSRKQRCRDHKLMKVKVPTTHPILGGVLKLYISFKIQNILLIFKNTYYPIFI